MDLSGIWKAAVVDEEINRVGTDSSFNDQAWTDIAIPGHWGSVNEFSETGGPIMFRKSFSHSDINNQKRSWLKLQGVMSESEVWLDSTYVGETAGYFVPHSFEVTDLLEEKREHLLAIEVSCPKTDNNKPKRSMTGSIQNGPLAPPGSPGGITGSIQIIETGNTAIKYSRLNCVSANSKNAKLNVRFVLNCKEADEVELQTVLKAPDGSELKRIDEPHSLASGENRIEWLIDIDNPELWWPASLGDQPLYEVEVDIIDSNGISDNRSWRTGLREIRQEKFVWWINDKKIFLKGIAVGPKNKLQDVTTNEGYSSDIIEAKKLGLDMVRIYGHVGEEATYETADELGIIIWQDLPLIGEYATGSKKAIKKMARAAVDLLTHHPSIGIWCCHDEPNGSIIKPSKSESSKKNTLSFGFETARRLLPSWNKSILDPVIKREIQSADPSRPVISRSGDLPTPITVERSDTNLWLGWKAATYKNLTNLTKKWPRLFEFPGGIGSQSVIDQYWEIHEPTWETAQKESFKKYLPRRAYANGKTWAKATRIYQADLIKFHVESFRKLMFKPCGGFCIYALRDTEPSGGFGVLDFEGKPKDAYPVLANACQPISVILETPPRTLVAGQKLPLALHAVSDLQKDFDAKVQVNISAGTWGFQKLWVGRVQANSCTFIANFELEVPALLGQVNIGVELVCDHLKVTNSYSSSIIPIEES